MMCYDKKLEASRPDFFDEDYQTRDVDCVITTGELCKMFDEQNYDIRVSPESLLDSFTKVTHDGQLLGTAGSASGGYLEYILEFSARELFGITDVDVDKQRGVIIKIGRNKDFKEVTLEVIYLFIFFKNILKQTRVTSISNFFPLFFFFFNRSTRNQF